MKTVSDLHLNPTTRTLVVNEAGDGRGAASCTHVAARHGLFVGSRCSAWRHGDAVRISEVRRRKHVCRVGSFGIRSQSVASPTKIKQKASASYYCADIRLCLRNCFSTKIQF